MVKVLQQYQEGCVAIGRMPGSYTPLLVLAAIQLLVEVVLSESYPAFTTDLVDGEIDVGPVVRRRETLGVIYNTNDVRFDDTYATRLRE